MEDKIYTILLVDDEQDNLDLLHRTLRHKYNIIKTTMPEEALELLKDNDVHLIISDHKMPAMDGVEFLRRTIDINPMTMRIMLTAFTDATVLINAINSAKIYRYLKKPFNPDELLLVVEASLDYFQLKKDNENLVNDLKDLFSGTIKAIIEALDAKDSFTLGRSRRVTFYALKMINYLNLPNSEKGKVELAGLLHDIGMIGVSDDILYKVDKLTDEEYEEIKKHVEHGVKILEDIKQLKEVVEGIKYHHEHFDGGGYPMGLKGDEIPLSARIISIADAFDSMISNRAYRNAMSYDEAMTKIEELSGKQFDPKLVDCFKTVLPEIVREITEYENAHPINQ